MTEETMNIKKVLSEYVSGVNYPFARRILTNLAELLDPQQPLEISNGVHKLQWVEWISSKVP